MDLSAVRNVAIRQTFQVLGTPMCATLPDGSSVDSLQVVWDAAFLESVDRNRQLGRSRNRQLGRSFWVMTEDLPDVPRGTLFEGPEPHGGDDKTWRADQKLAVEPGKIHVLVNEVKA